MKKQNRKIKALAAWVIALAVIIPMALPSFAGSGDVAPTDAAQIADILEAMQGRIDNLAEQIATPATPQVFAPNVKLLSPQSIMAEPGQALDVVISVVNIGTSSAQNVLTQATPEAPLSAVFLGNSNIVATIAEGKTAAMTMTVTVDASAKPGTYAITLDHSYKTRDDQNKTSTDKLFVHVGGTVSAANVTLGGFTSDRASIMPGESVNITANLENLGEGEAKQVQIALGEMDSTALYLTSDLNTTYLASAPAGYSGKVHFTFRAADNAESKTYSIPFKLTYKTANNEDKEASYTYFVNISSEPSSAAPNVQIKELNAAAGQINVGANANIALRLVNAGAGEANRIKVTATPADAAAIVPTSGNIQSIVSLAPGAEQVLNFSFSPTAGSKTQSYVVGFKVEYYDAEDTGADAVASSFEQYASISVNNPDAEEDDTEEGKTSIPKIIVSEYKVDPVIVRAGREFDLDIAFQNTSSVKAVENIKVTITAVETTEKKGSVFSPVGGSNTLYIDHMGIKEEVPNKLRFYTVSDAEARSYKLEIKFEYQDEDLNEYTQSEQIAINVQQVTKLEIDSEMYIPPTAMVGDQIDFYTSVINSGKVTIYNIWVDAEGEGFDTSQARVRIGTIGTGNSAQYDGRIIPTAAGKQEGAILVTGEDDVGDPVEISFPFSIEVMENMGGDMMGDPSMMGDPNMMGDPSMMGDPAMMGGEEPQGFVAKALDFAKRPYVWGTAIGVAVVIVLVIVGVVRRRKKRIDFDE